jgi:nucleoside-diphosphate-sugar epimerase
MESECSIPLNLGSTRMISINDLALLIASLTNKKINIKNVDGPIGVMGRNSDNTLIKKSIGWSPDENLEAGLIKTYKWIMEQLSNNYFRN